MSSGGKGGGANAGSKSYNYYGSIAGLIGVGPYKTFTGIEVDDKLAWSGTLSRATSPNPVEITIEGRGLVRLYWGTDDQLTTDPILATAGNHLGDDHPAYSGWAYFVLVDFLFGREKTSAPNVRIYGEREPQQTIITGGAATNSDGQANPFAMLAELYTSERCGLGMPTGILASASWQTAANAAQTDNALTYVSLLINRQVQAKSVAADMFALCDGYHRAEQNFGLLEVGVFPKPQSIDPNALPLIDSSMLDGVPDLDPETWDDVKTRWSVTYTDRDHNFKERAVKYDDPRARFSTGDARAESMKRSFITRSAQAFAHACEMGRRFALPGLRGSLPVRTERATSYRPGQHVRVDIDPEPGGAQLQQVCRVRSITRPPIGSARIEIEAERTLQPILYVPPVAPGGPLPPPSVPEIAHARFFEAPLGLAGGEPYKIGILASRPDALVIDFRTYYDDNAGGTFPRVGGSRAYALRGRVNTGFNAAATGPFRVELLDFINRELIDDNPGETAARDDSMLMIVLKIAGGGQIEADGDNKAYIEVFSCEEFVAAGTNLIDVTALRGRQGTPARDWLANAEVWFIRREALTIVEHADFADLAASSDNAYFKLQPGTREDERPLEDCTVRTFNFALNRETPPVDDQTVVEFRYKRSNLVPATPTGNTPAGWSLTRPSGSGAIWRSNANRSVTSGNIIGTWSTPVRIEGSVYFYQDTAPDSSLVELQVDDVWFDTDDENKIRTWNGSAWIARFQPFLKMTGGIVYGLQKADGTDGDFVMVADKFQIWNGASAEVPFEIIGGAVYIKEAFIKELGAGKITAGDIEVAIRLTAARIETSKLAGNVQIFHPEDPTRLFPTTSHVYSAVTGSGIASDVLTNDDLIFEGWLRDSPGFSSRRFGHASLRMDMFVGLGIGYSGAGGTTFAQVGPAYRTRTDGGSWSAWTRPGWIDHTPSEPGAFTSSWPVNGLTVAGNQSIQVGLAITVNNGGTASIVTGGEVVARVYNF